MHVLSQFEYFVVILTSHITHLSASSPIFPAFFCPSHISLSFFPHSIHLFSHPLCTFFDYAWLQKEFLISLWEIQNIGHTDNLAKFTLSLPCFPLSGVRCCPQLFTASSDSLFHPSSCSCLLLPVFLLSCLLHISLNTIHSLTCICILKHTHADRRTCTTRTHTIIAPTTPSALSTPRPERGTTLCLPQLSVEVRRQSQQV